jgi:hypothetical protein
MSANGTITIIWDHGEDDFCLAKAGSILALEEKCKAGVAVIFSRLVNGAWGLNDIRETIRLGLIGGGMKPDAAMAAVRNHVDTMPLGLSAIVATSILQAVIIGVPDDPLKKAKPAEAQDTGFTQTTDASDVPN